MVGHTLLCPSWHRCLLLLVSTQQRLAGLSLVNVLSCTEFSSLYGFLSLGGRQCRQQSKVLVYAARYSALEMLLSSRVKPHRCVI